MVGATCEIAGVECGGESENKIKSKRTKEEDGRGEEDEARPVSRRQAMGMSSMHMQLSMSYAMQEVDVKKKGRLGVGLGEWSSGCSSVGATFSSEKKGRNERVSEDSGRNDPNLTGRRHRGSVLRAKMDQKDAKDQKRQEGSKRI